MNYNVAHNLCQFFWAFTEDLTTLEHPMFDDMATGLSDRQAFLVDLIQKLCCKKRSSMLEVLLPM